MPRTSNPPPPAPGEAAQVAGLARLARAVARRLSRHRPAADFDDAYSDALLGVLLAVRLHDPARGVPLAALAATRARQAVLSGFRRRRPKGTRGERARKGREPSALPLPGDLAAPEVAPACEPADEVRHALRGLSARDRLVLWRRLAEGRGRAEVGAEVGLSPTGVQHVTRVTLAFLREREGCR